MSFSSLTGAFGFAPQIVKATAGTSFYWYRVYNSDFSPVTDERPFPQEVGGSMVPTGAYRAGAFAAGGIDFAPRLEDDLAWLLIWALGENPVTTIDTPVATMNRHRWTLSGEEDTLYWGTVHTIIPGTTELGIIGMDTKVSSLRLALPQAGLLAARLDLVGRLFNATTDNIFVEGPAGAGWTTSFEDYTTVPVSSKGGFIITGLNGDAELPCVGITIDIANALTTPQQEMIIGAYSPDDFVPVAKTVTVRGTVKWSAPDIYQTIATGAAAGTDWTESVFEGQAVIETQAPGNFVGTTPYELEITLPNVLWQITPPRLSGANIITMDVVGTAIKRAGENFMQLDWFTDAADAGYSWPV